jgi:hypothetical protein
MRHVDPKSLVHPPSGTVHLVLEDFGVLGRAYRETDEAHADAGTIIERILRGDYSAQVIAFNRDVSAQIARALIARAEGEGLPEHARRFVERHVVCLAY